MLTILKRSYSSLKLPPAIFGVGKNYLDHAKEMGSEKAPENMLIFMKNPNAIIRNGASIVIPKVC
jgi:2-keto-4-pentenoate hydratase/2-oxohepta-3-ene-1,7-dioic acid hydratase in catechol pathway